MWAPPRPTSQPVSADPSFSLQARGLLPAFDAAAGESDDNQSEEERIDEWLALEKSLEEDRARFEHEMELVDAETELRAALVAAELRAAPGMADAHLAEEKRAAAAAAVPADQFDCTRDRYILDD